MGERARLACCARRPAEHLERSTESHSSEPSARADSVRETPTGAAETAALPISTESSRLSGPGSHAIAVRLKPISHIPDGLNESGMFGVRFDLVAQRIDAPVHAAIGHNQVFAPNSVEDFLASESAAGIPGEEIEEPEFLRGERNFCAASK